MRPSAGETAKAYMPLDNEGPMTVESLDEIHALEHDLAAARDKLLRLEEEAGSLREGEPFH